MIDKQKELERKRKDLEQKKRKDVETELLNIKSELESQHQNLRNSSLSRKEGIRDLLKMKNDSILQGDMEGLEKEHERALEEAHEKEARELESKLKDAEIEMRENLAKKREELENKRQNFSRERERKLRFTEEKKANLHIRFEEIKRQVDKDFRKKLDACEKEERARLMTDQNRKFKQMETELEQLRLVGR